MKQTERKQLKENELAHWLGDFARMTGGAGAVAMKAAVAAVVVALAVVGFNAFRQRSESRGQQLLADAMVAMNARVVPTGAAGPEGEAPAAAQMGAEGSFSTEAAKLNAAIPKLQAAADGASGTQAGITARYYLASALASVGRYPDAIAAFDEVTRQAGAGTIYGRMARMGRADAQTRSGQVDQAITSWKELAGLKDDLPVDAVLLELARAYRTKGDVAEAKKTLSQLIDEHPNSAYAPEARTDLDGLSGS